MILTQATITALEIICRELPKGSLDGSYREIHTQDINKSINALFEKKYRIVKKVALTVFLKNCDGSEIIVLFPTYTEEYMSLKFCNMASVLEIPQIIIKKLTNTFLRVENPEILIDRICFKYKHNESGQIINFFWRQS